MIKVLVAILEMTEFEFFELLESRFFCLKLDNPLEFYTNWPLLVAPS